MPQPRLRGYGTRSGGLKTAAIVKARDPDYYRKIGAMGGLAPKTKPAGFAACSPEQVSAWGKKGGSRSSRKGVKTGEGSSHSTLSLKRKRELTAYEIYTNPDTAA